MTANTEKQNSKAFDAAVCFTFFGSWVEAITDLATEDEKNGTSYKLFKAISDYSMYGEEPDFSDEASQRFKPFWSMLASQIDASVKRRRSGFGKVEDSEAYQKVKAAYEECPDATEREIAKRTGVPASTVHNHKQRLSKAEARHTDPARSVSSALTHAFTTSGYSSTDYSNVNTVEHEHEQTTAKPTTNTIGIGSWNADGSQSYEDVPF